MSGFAGLVSVDGASPDKVSAELDLHYIGDFLLQGWCPDLTRTAFRDISRLPPGHILRCSSNGLEVRRYITLPVEEPRWLKRDEEYVERFRELLEQAVLDRLPRGRAAIFMSGGLDSTSVAAVAVDSARKRGQPLDLRAYTVDYQPLFDDQEGRLATLAAQHIGIPIEIQPGTTCLPYRSWDDFRIPLPEPFHEPYRALYVEQSRQIAQHARIVLNGYGGDGIMTGQAWPYLVSLLRRGRLDVLSRSFGGYILKHHRMPPLRGGFRSSLGRWTHGTDVMTGYPKWLNPEFESELNLRRRWRELCEPPATLHSWYPNAHTTISSGLWASVLESEDSAWTNAPIESRAPLLDLRIVRFLLRVPPVPLCMDKDLLRRAMKNYLPEEIRLRPKTPLLDDLLLLQRTNGDWTPRQIPELDLIHRFVHLEPLGEILQNRPAAYTWTDLRPISLLYWVRGIALGQRVQYGPARGCS